MTLIDKIRADQLKARKAKSEVASKLLTTLLGESLAVGKKSQREPTDAEVTAVIKQFVKKANETLDFIRDEGASKRALDISQEIAILTRYLPKQMDSNSLRECTEEYIRKHDTTNMGDVMKFFKQNYDGQYDAKLLSQIVKQLLS